MLAADHQRVADELLRVLRLGGTFGLATWTRASVVGGIFRLNLPE
jgi:hypothetical protein